MMEEVKQAKKNSYENNLTPPSKNDELFRTWVESKKTPTQEFMNKIVEWAKIIFNNQFGNEKYVTDRQLEGLLTDVTLKVIKVRNKFDENSGVKIYSYFHTLIINTIISELSSK